MEDVQLKDAGLAGETISSIVSLSDAGQTALVCASGKVIALPIFITQTVQVMTTEDLDEIVTSYSDEIQRKATEKINEITSWKVGKD